MIKVATGPKPAHLLARISRGTVRVAGSRIVHGRSATMTGPVVSVCRSRSISAQTSASQSSAAASSAFSRTRCTIHVAFVVGERDGKRTLTVRDSQHEYVYVETVKGK